MSTLGVNWFDIVALLVVISGVYVGRKRGMSLELVDLVQWLLIVFAGGYLHQPLGKWLAKVSGMGMVPSCVAAYLAVAFMILGLFVALRRIFGPNLLSGDMFGRAEYYLGMMAGGARFLCILVFALALFNAKQVSDSELAAQIKAQNENLGAIYFPPYGMVQRSVFQRSFAGRTVDRYLKNQLIAVDTPAAGANRRETIYRQRQREIDEVLR